MSDNIVDDQARIFVSSTVHDLLDVREELRATLVQMGLTAVLSDRTAQGFYVATDTDSVSACAQQVLTCVYYVGVLSQRYGFAFEQRDGLSATHVEYQTAREAGLPIMLFVRDGLYAAWETWKAQGRPASFSCRAVTKTGDAVRLFALIDEQAAFQQGTGKSNWVHPFSTSRDLCAIVRAQLGARARAKLLRDLIQAHRVPVLAITPPAFADGGNSPERRWVLRHLGGVPVSKVSVDGQLRIGALADSGLVDFMASIFATEIVVEFVLPTGELVRDRFSNGTVPHLVSRELLPDVGLVLG
jgi:hypothetical protein